MTSSRTVWTRRYLIGVTLLGASGVLAVACGAQPPIEGAQAMAATAPAESPVSAPTAQPTTSATPVPLTSPTTSVQGTPTSVPSPAQASQSTATPAAVPTSTAAPASLALQSPTLSPTPACVAPGELTPLLTEGPYFKTNSPERTSLLEPGGVGTKLSIAGRVLSTQCQPVVRALLDFWQADGQGNYDNVGFKFRGHQYSDESGAYRLETVIPGLYPGRTRHIHVKVQAPNGPVLTTQLFFPDEPRNNGDSIFDDKLVITMRDSASGEKVAAFDFVLNAE